MFRVSVHWVVGGSAMPRSLTERYENELGVNVIHAWGMTEMFAVGHHL